MDGKLGQLLMMIVERYEAPLEEKAAELGNPAAADLGTASFEERRREAGLRARAQDLAEPFAAALRAAARNREAPIRLRSAEADQSRMADALIQFLVRPGLATVQTEETSPDVFTYDISVAWPALRQAASEADIDLDDALRDQ